MITAEEEEAQDIIQHNSHFKNSPEISSQNRNSRKRNKNHKNLKGRYKSVCADGKIIYIGHSKYYSKELELMKNMSELYTKSLTKINVFLYTANK